MKHWQPVLICVFLLVGLAACGTPAAVILPQTIETTSTPAVEEINIGVDESVDPNQPSGLRLIPVEQVSIQIGEGSPIPAHIMVSGSWPDLCAQLAEVRQTFENSTFTVTLQATAEDKACPPDLVGLPFGFAIPINVVQLPNGIYSVVVNGVETVFVWEPNMLAAEENPMPVPLSFEASTYRNEAAGFEFDYPSSWTLNDLGQIGSRGSAVQLTSWAATPGEAMDEIPTDGSRMDVTLYTWDPKNDLDAYISTRKQAWDASGMNILEEEAWTIAEGQRAVLFNVLAADQTESALFLMTTAGDQYLVLSGTGNLDILREIMHTVRPTGLTMR